MALLPILRYPDPRLHTVAKPVAEVDDTIQQLVDDMLETMYDAKGVGLAATQVDRHVRVVVIDTSEERNEPRVLINPEIEPLAEEKASGIEACLSVPGLAGMVPRWTKIRYRALDLNGQMFEREASGYHARVVQHECDHLDGILYPMRMEDMASLAFVEELRRFAAEGTDVEDD